MGIDKGLSIIPRSLVMVLLVALTIVTFLAVRDFGYVGIVQYGLFNFATMQIFLDLVITLVLFLFIIHQDTKERNTSFWPWLVITLIFGTYGPLLYLLFRK